MKKWILIFFVIGQFTPLKAQLKQQINAENVDSIVIRTINWSSISFGYYGIDRKAFDELYQFISTDSVFREKEGMSIDSIIIKDDLSKFLFCAILNNLPKDEPQNAMPTPDEIWENCKGFEYNMGIMADGYYNGDPLEIRGQIRIYMKDGDVITAYMSPTLIDIFNERYVAFNLSSFITDYLYSRSRHLRENKGGQPFPEEDFDYLKESEMANPDSICIYDKGKNDEWEKLDVTLAPDFIQEIVDDTYKATLSDSTALYPSLKIDFYSNGICVELYVKGYDFKIYGMIYKRPYNLEEYIRQHFLKK
ncbi:MAG: hypothetical protein IKL35_06205 [Muribaculaceae bacterium]|nr:hypothetical protein [Muribaculaceae bacterium]